VLAQETIRLINTPDLRKKIGEKGRRRAEALFDWDICLQKTIDIYQQVVGRTN
jgi:glycosyltransferase involved in cell wall biosynthesis